MVAASHLLQLDTLQAAVVSSAVVSSAVVSRAVVSSAIVSSAMVSRARHVLQAAGLRCHPFGKRCARSFIHPADSIHVDGADEAGEVESSSARGEGEGGVDCAAAHMEASRVADCTSSRA